MSNDKLPSEEEEISLVDLIYSLLEHWRVFVVLPVVVALGVWAVVSMRPDQWEARGVIEIGAIGTIGGAGTVGITKIETVPMLLERINLPETRMRAGQILGSEHDKQNKELLINKISASRVRDTDLVELNVRAASRQEAEKQALAIIQAVQEGHLKEAEHVQKIIAQRLKERKYEYEALLTQIRTYRERSKASKNIRERSLGEDGLFAAYVASLETAYVAGLETRMHQLAAEIAELEVSATLPTARPTQLFGGATNVTSSLVDPRRGLFVVLAWLVGFSAALLSVFIHQVLRNAGKNAETASKLAKIRNLQWFK